VEEAVEEDTEEE
jgi:hypothetical protein